MPDFPPSDLFQLGGHLSPKFAAKKGAKRESAGRTVTQRIGIWTYGLSENSSTDWELDDAIIALLNRLTI